jgi:hypothetical protein
VDIGDTVTLIGEYLFPSADDGHVKLLVCQVMP